MSQPEITVPERRILVVCDNAQGTVVAHEEMDADSGETPTAFYERIGERKKELQEEHPDCAVGEYSGSSLAAILRAWPEDFRPRLTSAP